MSTIVSSSKRQATNTKPTKMRPFDPSRDLRDRKLRDLKNTEKSKVVEPVEIEDSMKINADIILNLEFLNL